MRSVTFMILLVFFFLLALVSFTFGAGFAGRTAPKFGVICPSGNVMTVKSRTYWFPGRGATVNKPILGVYKTTDSTSCCQQSGNSCNAITVYKVDKFGQ